MNTDKKQNYAREDEGQAPAVLLAASLMKEAVKRGASDIHIEPFEDCVTVRYRVDGELSVYRKLPKEIYPSLASRIKIQAGMNIAEKRAPQDGRTAMTTEKGEFDFRISTLPTVNGEKFVIRVLDKSNFSFTRPELGFTAEENAVVDKMLARPNGMILMTGPTGCGKSTTLYAFMREMNTERINIVTVEDPVEYTMQGINQISVNPKASLTFASALRSILRQDPDVIMIGEIRDEETAEIAVRAAMTGHIVFSTLHTSDAPGAVARLRNMGIEGYLIADALAGVIAQRLVKRLCPHCKRQRPATPEEARLLCINEGDMIYAPTGCPECGNTGYKGRIAVHEIMHVSKNIKNAILEGIGIDALREAAEKEGTVPLWKACRRLVLEGVTDTAEMRALYIEY